MTKIYCYCLFDGHGTFHGVYSSASAVHRDALKICSKGGGTPLIEVTNGTIAASATNLRNILKGAFDVQVQYVGVGRHRAKIIKTKLKE